MRLAQRSTVRTKYGVLNQKQKSRTDKHRSPDPKTVRPKMKTNPDHEERGLAHRLRCCCACAEKEPSKTRAKEQTQREEQGQETTTNFVGVLEAERLLQANLRRPRVEHDQSRDGREKGQVVVYVDAREKVECSRDLVCVAVRCTGGKHIVMRAVSRMTHGWVTIASEETDRNRAWAGIY